MANLDLEYKEYLKKYNENINNPNKQNENNEMLYSHTNNFSDDKIRKQINIEDFNFKDFYKNTYLKDLNNKKLKTNLNSNFIKKPNKDNTVTSNKINSFTNINHLKNN